jgi:tRNA (guanine37-N1)-methyltransferase
VPQSICLKVPKILGEKALRLTKELSILDRELKIKQFQNFLCIPLRIKPESDVIKKFKKKLIHFEFSKSTFIKKQSYYNQIDILEKKIPHNLLAKISRAIDFIGDIAIIEINPELEDYKKIIGEALLTTHKQIKTILAKSSLIEGLHRLRDFEFIAGIKKTVTLHKEYGCIFKVDVARTYFSPRLSNEHNRVALTVKNNDIVVDLFSGVGPFAIHISKKQENVKVYSIEINPNAISLLKQNITLNRVEKQVIPILGDSRKIIKDHLSGKADRVIMNLPKSALKFVDVACDALKPKGGIIHYYDFVKGSNPLKKAQVRLDEAIKENNRKISNIIIAKKVREIAPYTYQVVLDAEIQ